MVRPRRRTVHHRCRVHHFRCDGIRLVAHLRSRAGALLPADVRGAARSPRSTLPRWPTPAGGNGGRRTSARSCGSCRRCWPESRSARRCSSNLPRGPALLLLGIFVGVYGVHLLGGQREWKALHPRWAWPLGFAGGVFSVLFGTGGPIFMIFLAARIHDKSRLRATSSIVVMVSVSISARPCSSRRACWPTRRYSCSPDCWCR